MRSDPLARRRVRQLAFLVAAVGAVLAGCIPYPIHKTLQPEATVTVLTEARIPVAGAEVQLVANAYPYGREKSRARMNTGPDGLARFESRREWRTEWLMIHGAEVFFWNWCVRRGGYATFATSHRSASEFENELVVQLVSGQSTPCPVSFR